MSAHTPGPWKFDTSKNGWSYTIHISQADDADYTPDYSDVGYIMQTCTGENQSIQEANARLIAAAPELLAVLQDMRKRGHLFVWVGSAPEDEAIKRRAIAAIEKATK